MIHEAIIFFIGVGILFDLAILALLHSTIRAANDRTDRYAAALLHSGLQTQAGRAVSPVAPAQPGKEPADGRSRPRQIGLSAR